VILRLAITAVILALLARGIDFGESARAIATIDLRYLALVLGLVAIDRSVMIWRWILLLRSSAINISSGGAARLFLISSFVGSFLPAGVGADAARAYGLSRETTSGSEALASVAVDRILGVFSIVVMSMVGVIAWAPARGDWRIAAAILALTIACSAVFWAGDWLRWAIPDAHHDHAIAGQPERARGARTAPQRDHVRAIAGPHADAERDEGDEHRIEREHRDGDAREERHAAHPHEGASGGTEADVNGGRQAHDAHFTSRGR